MADALRQISEPQITFTIKNPSKHDADAFKLTVPLSATLADIQRRIAAEYDGNPSPSSQTLIYAGKVLKDPALVVKDIIQQSALADGSHSHSMHLVVRAPAPSVGSTPNTSTGGTVQPAPAGNTSQGPAQASAATPDRTSAQAPAEGAATPAADAPVADSTPQPRSHDSSSSGSDQHTDDPADLPAAAAPGMSAGFAAPAGLSPMFVFGAHGSSNGLLYAGHGPAGQLNLLGPHSGLSQPGAGLGGARSSSGTSAGAPALPGIQQMPYPYMMNLINPMMNNPMMATAYHAAYSAALHSMRQQPGGSSTTGPGATTAGGAGTSSAAATGTQANVAAGQQLPAAVAAAHTPLVPLTAPLAPAALLYYPAAFQQAAMAAAAAAAAAGQQQGDQQQQHAHAAFAAPAGPFPMAAPFAVPLLGIPAHLAAQQAAAAAQPAGGAGAVGGAGAGNARLGLRQRFPQGFVIARPGGARQQQQGPQQGVQGPAPAGVAGQGHGHRRYRTRTITFRISMRTLLQMLVFGMVLYQHCTWPRLCILLAGVVILYITALWPPFRQFVVSLARPPQPEQLAQMQQRRQQQAAQQQQDQQPQDPPAQPQAPAAGAAAPQPAGAPPAAADQPQPAAAGAAAPAAGAAAQQHQQPGLGPHQAGQPPLPAWLQQGPLREVLAVIVSFITSLFPAWNYNAEDAAVFAAAQEMLAREEQQQRQAQGQAGAAGGNAGFP